MHLHLFCRRLKPMSDCFKNLNRIEFVITCNCTGKCKHCSAADMKSERVCINGTQAVENLTKIAKKHNITSVMTFGGEPLLYPNEVCLIHKKALELEIPKRQLITNGYFSNDINQIKKVVNMLYESGVNDILLSVDSFHFQTIPSSAVKLFANELVKLNMPVRLTPAWLVSREDDNVYNVETRKFLQEFILIGIPESEGNVIFPEGNAVKYLKEYFNSEKEYKNPYEDKPDDIRSISFDPDGVAYGGGKILNFKSFL